MNRFFEKYETIIKMEPVLFYQFLPLLGPRESVVIEIHNMKILDYNKNGEKNLGNNFLEKGVFMDLLKTFYCISLDLQITKVAVFGFNTSRPNSGRIELSLNLLRHHKEEWK